MFYFHMRDGSSDPLSRLRKWFQAAGKNLFSQQWHFRCFLRVNTASTGATEEQLAAGNNQPCVNRWLIAELNINASVTSSVQGVSLSKAKCRKMASVGTKSRVYTLNTLCAISRQYPEICYRKKKIISNQQTEKPYQRERDAGLSQTRQISQDVI